MNIFLDRLIIWLNHLESIPILRLSLFKRVGRTVAFPILLIFKAFLRSIQYVQKCLSSFVPQTDVELRSEFASLTKVPCTASLQYAGQNLGQNRYIDVQPYDHSLVSKSPYYNASWVLQGKAIASQGPMKHQIECFWGMIWNSEPCLITMVTDLYEGNLEKCSPYWEKSSLKDFAQFGEYSIRTTTEETLCQGENQSIVKRVFEVSKGSEIKNFVQLQLVGWPDNGDVEYKIFKKFVQIAMQEKKITGPLFTHCSAGVGRTGAFLSAFYAWSTGQKRIFPIVEALRLDRVLMVQNPEQFILAQRTVESLLSN